MSREENSVLFSLNHLKAMAAATASNAVFSPAPVREPSFDSLYVGPGPIAASVLLAPVAPSERPRWMIPAIAGVGSLLLLFLVLVFVLVLHKPAPAALAAPAPALAAIPAAAPTPAPQPEPTRVASATPAPAEERSTAEEGKAKEPKKVSKAKKRGKARFAKRGKRGKRAPMVVAAAPTKAKAKKPRRRDALDDLLDSALK